jgi:hypothetical protein
MEVALAGWKIYNFRRRDERPEGDGFLAGKGGCGKGCVGRYCSSLKQRMENLCHPIQCNNCEFFLQRFEMPGFCT